MTTTVGQQFRSDVIRVDVLLNQSIDITVGCCFHGFGELVDPPGVHLHTEADFRLRLVAFGNGDEAHVVAESCELETASSSPSCGRTLPVFDLLQHGGVGNVSDHRLACDPEPGLDEIVID